MDASKNHLSLKKTDSFAYLKTVFFGICMGIADIIPGISGGTIAFIMGFYEDLLNSIQSFNISSFKLLFTGQFRLFLQTVSWGFILSLLTGIVIAMVTLSHVVTYTLNHEEYRSFLYAAFFGLIIAASILCAKELKKWKMIHVVSFLTALITAFLLTSVPSIQVESKNLFSVPLNIPFTEKEIHNYDKTKDILLHVSDSTLTAMVAKGVIQENTVVYNEIQKEFNKASIYTRSYRPKIIDPWIILCGAIAICAMILPGISGSYLLTILGMYATVIAALADFTGSIAKGAFDSSSFFILANMFIGILIGALTFTRFVKWLLDHYHDLAIATLTGFMVGALQTLWPFWNYQYIINPLKLDKGLILEPLHIIWPSLLNRHTWIAIGFTFLGIVVVFLLQTIAAKVKEAKITSYHQVP